MEVYKTSESQDSTRSFSPGWIAAACAVGLIFYPVVWRILEGWLPEAPYFSDGPRLYSTIFAWVAFAAVLYCAVRAGASLRSVGFPLRWRWWQLALLITSVVLVFLAAIDASYSGAEPLPGAPAFGWNLPERLTFIFLAGLTAAIVEETIFRGLALTYLPAFFSGRVWIALVISSLLFAAAHGDPSPANFGFRFLLSVGFSLLFLWRRSLRLPIFMHWLINASGPAFAP